MNDFTLGEFCAGIGGFGLGFEQAGWRTRWQVELDDINRAVLASRFPGAVQYKDLRQWRSYGLPHVKCIAFGSPCQDISRMGVFLKGKRQGLQGSRSGLFFTIMESIAELRPDWVVWENVHRRLN